MVGKVYPKGTLFLSIEAGSAGNGERSYQLLTSWSSGVPMMESKQTGKAWSISWKELLDFAIAAGIVAAFGRSGATGCRRERHEAHDDSA